jgi:hypothetical protein
VKKTTVIAIAFAAVLLAAIIYTTMGNAKYRCEVCITFHERSACRTAAASTEAQALRTATENTCAQLASGVTDSMQCESTPPSSVVWLSQK